MIIYEDTCGKFIESCLGTSSEPIEDILLKRMKCLHFQTQSSEYHSWSNSLPELAKVLDSCGIPKETEVGLEYTIDRDNHRIDALLCGLDKNGKETVIVIELKQWSTAEPTKKKNFVHTMGGAGQGDYWHPSIQAANYAGILKNFNLYVQEKPVILRACSYLHNMPQGYHELLEDEMIYPSVKDHPVFLKGSEDIFGKYLHNNLIEPCDELLYRIDKSDRKCSPELGNMLMTSLKGNEFFSYSDEQADAVSTIVQIVDECSYYKEKKVIIIRGRPGTGKSIVAINALGILLNASGPYKGYQAAYFTKNNAPRLYYKEKLIDEDYTKTAIAELFKNPISLKSCPENEYDCALFDEAHRMFDWKGGTGLAKSISLIGKCIESARVSVFFIDEDQAVTVYDYLTIEKLKATANKCHVRTVDGPVLKTQFRVLGGDGYIQTIRHILGYPDATYPEPFDKYDFRVFDDVCDMREELRKMNEKYGASRMVAGYTYEWITKDDYNKGYDIILEDGKFRAKWNMQKKDYSWLNDKNSFEDVGSIHTCQGLDMQYCGVIIGLDMRAENGRVIYDQTKEAKSDRSSGIRTCKDPSQAIRLIRNTYNVLLTRGMRGTFVYCEDIELKMLFHQMIDALPKDSDH